MPCHDALTTKVFTLSPDDKVERALDEMKKNGVTFAPVVTDGRLAGVFSIGRLLQNTLPVSVTMEAAGGRPNIRIPAAPGLGRRLQKSKAGVVEDMMERNAPILNAAEPLEAAIRHVAARGEPVCVVDGDGAFLGTLTEGSVLALLEKDADAA